MRRVGVKGDKVLYNTLVNGCVYGKNVDAAYNVCLDSFAMNVKLAEDVYNNLLKNLMYSKDHTKISWAVDVSERMKSKGIQPEPYIST